MAHRREEFGPFTFEAPAEWSRRMVLVYSDPSKSASPIVLTRDQRLAGEALPTYAWRRLFEIARDTPDRRVVDARATRLGEQPAFRATLHWMTPSGPAREAIAWVDGGDGAVLVASCTSMEEDDAFQPFEQVLAGIRFGASPPISSVPPTPPAPPRSSPPPAFDNSALYGSVPMPGARPMRR